MNGNDKFIATSGIAILFISSIVVYTYPEFFIATIISTIAAVVFIIIAFLLFIVYDADRIQAKKDAEAEIIKKERELRIKKEKEKKIREQKRKLKLEQEERKAYAEGRSSRTAKAAKLLDMMESSKRRM